LAKALRARSRSARKPASSRFEIGPETGLVQVENLGMGVAVTGDLVSRVGDTSDQGRIAFGGPPQHEERGLYVEPLEHIQTARGIVLHAGLHVIPGLGRIMLQIVMAVKPLFHVDGQDVG